MSKRFAKLIKMKNNVQKVDTEIQESNETLQDTNN